MKIRVALVLLLLAAVARPCRATLAINIQNNGSGGTQLSWSGAGPYESVDAFAVDFYFDFGTSIFSADVDPNLMESIPSASGLAFAATPPGSNLLATGVGSFGSLDGLDGGVSSSVFGVTTGSAPPGLDGTYLASGTASFPAVPFSVWKTGTYVGTPFLGGAGLNMTLDGATLTIGVVAVPEAGAWLMLSVVGGGALGLIVVRRRIARR